MGGGKKKRSSSGPKRDYAGEAANAAKEAEARAAADAERLREQNAVHQAQMAKLLENVNKPQPYTPGALKIGSTTGDTRTGLSRKDKEAKSKRRFRPRDTKIALSPSAGVNVGTGQTTANV